MAAANYVTVTPALAELISSLPQEEVPFKLRCAICSKLAVNAFKTPCCEQMLCENCTSTLPTTCPVCEHTPVSVDDCKPNNKLRMTTRAFLKTAEKKRDSAQTKEATPATPLTPADLKPTATPAPTAVVPEVVLESAGADIQEPEQSAEAGGSADPNSAFDPAEDATKPRPVIEGETTGADLQVSEKPDDEEAHVEASGEPAEPTGDVETAEDPTEGGEDTSVDVQQQPVFANGPTFNGMNGQLSNMPFGGSDFSQMNQMQMMMAMQNGMAPNGFNFPMMGMPGIGIDPSMMNDMFQMNSGFGAPGMGMMNGGMGGFNGGVGSEENWNGPQAWNNAQNNYNHPNASGMGSGDYGNFNNAYHTGYNQGNFGLQNNQFNDFRGGRGYFRGARGRGRGYGNFGRGGFGYGQQGNYQGQNQNQGYMNQQHQQYGSNMMGQSSNGPQPGGSQNGHAVSAGDVESGKNVDEYGRALRTESTQEEGPGVGKTEVTEDANGGVDKIIKEETDGPQTADNSSVLQPISVIETVTLDPDGDTNGSNAVSLSMRPHGHSYDNHQRGSSFGGMPPPAVPAPDVPLNAPTGPKAMRQGLPNTSLLHLRAKGYSIPGEESLSISTNHVQSPSVMSGHGSLNTPLDEDRERDRRRSRSNSLASTAKRRGTGERERSGSRSRTDRGRSDRHRDRDRRGTETRSNSRSRSREHRDRKRKHRSDEDVEDRDYDKDKERRHRHRSSKKYYDDEEPRSSTRDDKYADRSRSASPGSRKSSRREKRRERDRDEDDDRDHKHKSSHSSSHRHRDSRSEREREREGKDRDRKRDRDRDRGDRDHRSDRDREQRDSKRRSKHSGTVEPPTPTEPSADRRESDAKDFNPPTGPRGSISKNYSIFNAPRPVSANKGAGAPPSRPSSSSSSIPKGPRASAPSLAKDPHAAEREARNRERLLKETQRLAGMGGGGSLKRRSGADESADGGGGGGGGGGRGSRKKRRAGAEVHVDEEETLKRAEAEREGARWG